jgi:hypothetical protein
MPTACPNLLATLLLLAAGNSGGRATLLHICGLTKRSHTARGGLNPAQGA